MDNEVLGKLISSDLDLEMTIGTIVRDNSQRNEIKSITPAGYGAIQPFFGAKGPTNRFVKIQSGDLMAFETLFGKESVDNIDKYGYGGIIIEQILKGGGDVHVCRLSPDNAKAANFVFAVGVEKKADLPVYERISSDDEDSYKYDLNGDLIPKKDADGNVETTSGVYLSFLQEEYIPNEGQTVGNWKDKFVRNTEPNITYYPILMGEINFDGDYSNNYRLKFELDLERDGETEDGRRFAINFMEFVTDENGTSSLKNINPDEDGDSFTFSFNPNAVFIPGGDSSESFNFLYKNDIVDVDSNYPVGLRVNYKILKELLSELSNHTVDGDMYDIDFISGLNLNQKPYKRILLKETEPLFIKFVGGHGGSLETGIEIPNPADTSNNITVTQTIVDSTKTDLLKSFFNHDIDSNSIDSKIIPAAVSFDANWDIEVKKMMVSNFIRFRHDMTVYIDAGLEKDRDRALSIIREIRDYTDTYLGYKVRFVPHAGIATDRDILLTVPGTYEVARGKMALFAEKRLFSIYAGTTNGKLKYTTPFWISKTDKDGSDVRELKELSCKYVKQYGEDKKDLCFLSDATLFGNLSSKLRSERNSDIICDGIRIAQTLLIHYVFDERKTAVVQSESIEQFNKIIVGRYGDNIEVEMLFSQSKRDLRRGKQRVHIFYKFPDIPNGFIVELIVTNQEN